MIITPVITAPVRKLTTEATIIIMCHVFSPPFPEVVLVAVAI